MMVLPSDSLIKDGDRYRELVSEACEIAGNGDNLVTMGIRPSYPETGYGYIKFLNSEKHGNAYKVDRFVEKPSLEKAREYLETGEYLWNAGMFVWKVSTILGMFGQYLPDMKKGLDRIKEAIGTPEQEDILKGVFPELESVSIAVNG